MLSEPKVNSPEFRCWNGLNPSEFAALMESGKPLEGCKCRGCVFLVVRGWKSITRAELVPKEAACLP